MVLSGIACVRCMCVVSSVCDCSVIRWTLFMPFQQAVENGEKEREKSGSQNRIVRLCQNILRRIGPK